MAKIVPAVLAPTPAEYKQRLERVSFAPRLHIDISDGQFAPGRTIGLAQLYLPESSRTDLHLMLQRPEQQLETLISLAPQLVIAHYECAADLPAFFAALHQMGIKTGLALLAATTVEQAKALLPLVDHLLIFTGELGSHGGQFQAGGLEKLRQARQYRPGLELSVDGGIDLESAQQAAAAGADIIISGGFIQNSARPQQAYQQLQQAAQ